MVEAAIMGKNLSDDLSHDLKRVYCAINSQGNYCQDKACYEICVGTGCKSKKRLEIIPPKTNLAVSSIEFCQCKFDERQLVPKI